MKYMLSIICSSIFLMGCTSPKNASEYLANCLANKSPMGMASYQRAFDSCMREETTYAKNHGYDKPAFGYWQKEE